MMTRGTSSRSVFFLVALIAAQHSLALPAPVSGGTLPLASSVGVITTSVGRSGRSVSQNGRPAASVTHSETDILAPRTSSQSSSSGSSSGRITSPSSSSSLTSEEVNSAASSSSSNFFTGSSEGSISRSSSSSSTSEEFTFPILPSRADNYIQTTKELLQPLAKPRNTAAVNIQSTDPSKNVANVPDSRLTTGSLASTVISMLREPVPHASSNIQQSNFAPGSLADRTYRMINPSANQPPSVAELAGVSQRLPVNVPIPKIPPPSNPEAFSPAPQIHDAEIPLPVSQVPQPTFDEQSHMYPPHQNTYSPKNDYWIRNNPVFHEVSRKQPVTGVPDKPKASQLADNLPIKQNLAKGGLDNPLVERPGDVQTQHRPNSKDTAVASSSAISTESLNRQTADVKGLVKEGAQAENAHPIAQPSLASLIQNLLPKDDSRPGTSLNSGSSFSRNEFSSSPSNQANKESASSMMQRLLSDGPSQSIPAGAQSHSAASVPSQSRSSSNAAASSADVHSASNFPKRPSEIEEVMNIDGRTQPLASQQSTDSKAQSTLSTSEFNTIRPESLPEIRTASQRHGVTETLQPQSSEIKEETSSNGQATLHMSQQKQSTTAMVQSLLSEPLAVHKSSPSSAEAPHSGGVRMAQDASTDTAPAPSGNAPAPSAINWRKVAIVGGSAAILTSLAALGTAVGMGVSNSKNDPSKDAPLVAGSSFNQTMSSAAA